MDFGKVHMRSETKRVTAPDVRRKEILLLQGVVSSSHHVETETEVVVNTRPTCLERFQGDISVVALGGD